PQTRAPGQHDPRPHASRHRRAHVEGRGGAPARHRSGFRRAERLRGHRRPGHGRAEAAGRTGPGHRRQASVSLLDLKSMSSTMQTLIAKVGKGEKGAKDLTHDEAKEAMRLLLEGVATTAQVGSFLVAMRIKGESVSELAAFTATAREYAPPLPVPPGLGVVDIPTYAGKQDSWHVLLPAAIVAAAVGVPILLHGYDDVPGRLATATVAARLGIPT